jgi:hypothetical protein
MAVAFIVGGAIVALALNFVIGIALMLIGVALMFG